MASPEQHAHVKSICRQLDFGRHKIGTENGLPIMPVYHFSPTKLVRAIRKQSNRLGLGEGKHLLSPQIRRNDRNKRRSQQLFLNEIQSTSSQASIYSLIYNQTERDSISISSCVESNCNDLPRPVYNGVVNVELDQEEYDSDNRDANSKYSDEFPYRPRKNLYRSGVRGTQALLRLAHMAKIKKSVETIPANNTLYKSSSFLSSRFVAEDLIFMCFICFTSIKPNAKLTQFSKLPKSRFWK